MYQLTESGRELARLLANRSVSQEPVPKAALGRDLEQELKRLLTAKATEKFSNNLFSEVTFYDACSFWGITPRSSAVEFTGRIRNIEQIVKSTMETLQEKSASFDHGGRVFGASDLVALLEVHKQLLSKFHDEISIIQKRTDERK